MNMSLLNKRITIPIEYITFQRLIPRPKWSLNLSSLSWDQIKKNLKKNEKEKKR